VDHAEKRKILIAYQEKREWPTWGSSAGREKVGRKKIFNEKKHGLEKKDRLTKRVWWRHVNK